MNKTLPYGESFFDVVVCGDGIAHLKRPFDFVAEVHRVLKPGGVFLLSTPNLSNLRSRMRYFLTGFHNKRKVPLNESNYDPEHIVNALDFPDMRYLLHSSGFSITSIQTNRYKFGNVLYAFFLPFVFLFTLSSFIKEVLQRNKSREDFLLYKDVFKQMLKTEVLFGETLILKLSRRDP
jgi:SAM-dependent methyltransferase